MMGTTTKRLGRMTIGSLALIVAVGAPAADWPQFRGPNRDGVSSETGLLTSWPKDGPRVLWRTELGEGFSGIAVVKGQLYTMFGAGEKEYAAAYDAATGKEIWRHQLGPKWIDRFGNGPRATPTVDGDVVYVLSGQGDLAALKAADGTAIWSHDLRADYSAKPPRWGVSTSPLVEGDMLLVNVGGDGHAVVAFDKKTGKEIWASQDDAAGYSAPLALTIGEQRQLLFFTAAGLIALAPSDGKLLWRQKWKTSYDVNASTPIFIAPDKIFVSTGYDVGAAVYRVGDGGLEEIWRNRGMKNKFSSSVLHEAHLYGFDESTLKCIDAESGETLWRKRAFGHGSLLYADGHLIVLGDAGQLALVEATPNAYNEKSVAQIFKGKTWTMPTLVDGNLYLRDQKELISLKISG